MTPGTRHGNGAGGNGAGGFDDFDDFIRDREDDFEPGWSRSAAGGDPYGDYGQAGGQRSTRRPGIDRTLIDAILGVVDSLSGATGDALAPDLRKQLQKTLRDLLMVLRDIIDALIERIDRRNDGEVKLEEIPID